MEVRVEGRGLEVHCRRGTSGRFLYDFFVSVFMAWHGMAWHGFAGWVWDHWQGGFFFWFQRSLDDDFFLSGILFYYLITL